MTTHAAPSPGELFSLTDKTAVVTGASSGLGERFCLLLTAAGAQVIAVARREERLASLAARSPRIVPVVADVTSARDRLLISDLLRKRGVRADILVNNAGVSSPLRAEDEDPDGFARVLDVNLTSAYALTRELVTVSNDSDGVSVINVSSIIGLVAGAPIGGAGYAASKAGLIGLTRELAGQWGSAGVRVNAIAPGWFPSEMTAGLFADPASSKWVDRNTMLGRPGRDGELDGALLFLAASASSYVTGQVIAVDGGWTAR